MYSLRQCLDTSTLELRFLEHVVSGVDTVSIGRNLESNPASLRDSSKSAEWLFRGDGVVASQRTGFRFSCQHRSFWARNPPPSHRRLSFDSRDHDCHRNSIAAESLRRSPPQLSPIISKDAAAEYLDLACRRASGQLNMATELSPPPTPLELLSDRAIDDLDLREAYRRSYAAPSLRCSVRKDIQPAQNFVHATRSPLRNPPRRHQSAPTLQSSHGSLLKYLHHRY